MFDNYVCKEEHAVRCPGCRCPQSEFQTKVFKSTFTTWLEGERIMLDGVSIEEGSFEPYGMCVLYDRLIFVDVPIRGGVLGAPTQVGFKEEEEVVGRTCGEGTMQTIPSEAAGSPAPKVKGANDSLRAEVRLSQVRSLVEGFRWNAPLPREAGAVRCMELLCKLAREYQEGLKKPWVEKEASKGSS